MAHVVEVFSKITFWTSPRCPCGGRGRPWRVTAYDTFSDQRGTLPAQRQYSPHSTPDRDWRPKIR
jgi:hypothetical protein